MKDLIIALVIPCLALSAYALTAKGCQRAAREPRATINLTK